MTDRLSLSLSHLYFFSRLFLTLLIPNPSSSVTPSSDFPERFSSPLSCDPTSFKCLYYSRYLGSQDHQSTERKWVKSFSHVWLFLTSWIWAYQPLHPWDFPGKSTGVGCHFLLQGIFRTQGSNPGLPHCRQTSELPGDAKVIAILHCWNLPFAIGILVMLYVI